MIWPRLCLLISRFEKLSTSIAHLDYLGGGGGGGANVNRHGGKRSGVKTAQNSKTEGAIERTRHENVKLKKEDKPGAILPRQKPEECTVYYRSLTLN